MTRDRDGPKMAADDVAREVMDGLARNRAEIPVGRTRRFARLQRIAPGWAARIVRRR